MLLATKLPFGSPQLDYRLRYGVLGLRYSFDKFREMVYSEIRLDDSLSVDGTRPGNTYTVGVRWDVP